MKIIPIPLSFGLTDTIYETKMGFKTADVNSAVLQFTSDSDPVGCVATLSMKNETDNSNRYSLVLEQMAVTVNPFSYVLGDEIGSSGVWIGEITLKKDLVTVCSQEFRFAIGESLQTSIMDVLIQAKSVDEMMVAIQEDVTEHLGKSTTSVAQITSYVNGVVAKLLATDNTRTLQERERVLAELTRETDYASWVLAVQTLIDTAVIDARVQAIIDEYQSTYAQSLLSVSQQLVQTATKAELSAIATPLVATLVSQMTNVARIYVYKGSEGGYTNGNWYYHNGAVWVSGGVYQATGIGDDSVKITSLTETARRGQYPFQKNATLQFSTDSASVAKIYRGIKSIVLFNADPSKTYSLFRVRRGGSNLWQLTIREVVGQTMGIVVCDWTVTGYTEPIGVDKIIVPQYPNGGVPGVISAEIVIDWTAFTLGDNLFDMLWDQTGISPLAYEFQESRIKTLEAAAGIGVSLPNKVKVYFPKKVYGILGESVEVFHRGVIAAPNPYAFPLETDSPFRIRSRKIDLSFTTLFVGENRFLKIYNPTSGQMIEQADFKLYTTNPASKVNPSTVKNIICIGDSVVDNGTWVQEFARRLTGTGGTPSAFGLTNYNFIGEMTDGTTKNEGRSGYTWDDYLYNPNQGRPEVNYNPFWNTTTSLIDFHAYMTKNGFTGDIDYVVLSLGWNNFMTLAHDIATIKARAKAFIDLVHAEYPNCKIFLCGMNTTSPFNNAVDTYYINKRNMEMGMEYENIANDVAYSGFVRYIPITAFFDSEYGMIHIDVAANSRSSELIKTCTDYVHPATSGQLQIADAAIRAFMYYI